MKSPEEAYSVKVASEPFVHDGRTYFTMTWIEGNEYSSSIYSYDGQGMRRVTFGGHEKHPVLHNDSLYYISHTKEKDSLMVIGNLNEPRELFFNKAISDFTFHGDTILVLARDDARDDDPFVTRKLKYRFDTDGFLRSRTKLVSVSTMSEILVAGDFDVTGVASNGSRVIFSASIEDDDHGLEDVYELNMDDHSYSRITSGEGEVGAICLSPDGEVAYVGHRKGLAPWASQRLVFPESGKEVEVGSTAGNTINSDLFVPGKPGLVWAGGGYYLIGQEGASSYLYRYGGDLERLTTGGKAVRAFHASDESLAYVYTSHEKPSILVMEDELDLNPDVKGQVPDRIEYQGMEAWIYYAGKERPSILSVHGGPHTAYGNAYSIEFNYLVDHGFNVIMGNPRGSDGYGEDFAEACAGDWGGKDFEDLIGFIDTAAEKYGLRDNFSITGGSYGGYMTNAAITKTRRFKSAIAERCVSNLMSMCGTSDIGFWFNALESDVEDPYSEEGMRKLLEASPVFHAKDVETPTMFIHGELDYRCPIEQSEQMYTALRLNGVEAELVRYPGDSHEHARRGVPRNMRDRLERKEEWFSIHMGTSEPD